MVDTTNSTMLMDLSHVTYRSLITEMMAIRTLVAKMEIVPKSFTAHCNEQQASIQIFKPTFVRIVKAIFIVNEHA
jgi:hypothetical protein